VAPRGVKRPQPRTEEIWWDVVLVGAGASPIALIRELREQTGRELRDLESLVDSLPETLKHAVPRADAESLRKRLETAGARVEVRRAPASRCAGRPRGRDTVTRR
jgi:large subunit ribosomal protein L7/L12